MRETHVIRVSQHINTSCCAQTSVASQHISPSKYVLTSHSACRRTSAQFVNYNFEGRVQFVETSPHNPNLQRQQSTNPRVDTPRATRDSSNSTVSTARLARAKPHADAASDSSMARPKEQSRQSPERSQPKRVPGGTLGFCGPYPKP